MGELMKCEDVRAFFSEYYDEYDIDGENKTIHMQVSMHLDTCDACAQEFDKYAKLLDDVWTLPDVVPPENFHSLLMDYVELHKDDDIDVYSPLIASTKKREPSLVRKIVSYTAVAACLIAAFVWTMYSINNSRIGLPSADGYHSGGIIGFEPLAIDEAGLELYHELGPGARIAGNDSDGIIAFEPIMIDIGQTGADIEYVPDFAPEPSRRLFIVEISIIVVIVVLAAAKIYTSRRNAE